ncbi:DUF1489 domain-containing protein [Aliiroseovarius sp. N1F302]|uniref:DUF1489 family protein n=1 Tax=Aliiroseovarius sediminis TaxID=2925839 RepID=UPI001F5A92A3|nr:DUF1489 domain-containing protein [Aliiroseovarius sediminis]MCI2394956.1 DUF1489 domain-containing protein [Aliiroseovarius sediminis]
MRFGVKWQVKHNIWGGVVASTINLVKLCVGAEKVEDLETWQASRMAQSGQANPRHITRMWPKRADELLSDGSLYWVFKGFVLARQRVIRLDEVIGDDGIRRCGIVLDPQIIRTEAQPRRAFQGWRYLTPQDAPRDLSADGTDNDTVLPSDLAAALADIGIR